MIIIKFKGGLGNQMFQYANYLALKHRYPDESIYADISQYNMTKFHNGLEIERIFGSKLKVLVGIRGKQSFLTKYFFGSLSLLLELFFKSGVFKKFKYLEDTNDYNSELKNINNNTNYLVEGYWGDERYFKDFESLIREKLAFKVELGKANQSFLKSINDTNSVSVHIRRGDYLSAGSGFVDLCKGDYYPNALRYINEHVSEPNFFIFTDDVKWCRDHLTWLSEYQHQFVEGNYGNSSYIDLQLMSHCKYNIIANSTFSWWGGWLNNAPEKIVICPRTLFYDKMMNDKIVSDFYPSSWIKL